MTRLAPMVRLVAVAAIAIVVLDVVVELAAGDGVLGDTVRNALFVVAGVGLLVGAFATASSRSHDR